MTTSLKHSTRTDFASSIHDLPNKLYRLHDSSNCKYMGNLLFEGINFITDPYDTITFKNCNFSSALSFQGCKFSANLRFIDCEFSNGLSFVSTQFKGILYFHNCKIPCEAILSDSSIDQMTFEACSLADYYISGNIESESIRNFPIKFLETSLKNLKIENAVLKMPLALWNVSAESFHSNNTTFESGISFGSHKGHRFDAENIFIVSSDIKQRLDFYQGNIEGQIWMQKVRINEQMVFRKEFNVGSWIKMLEVRASHAVTIDFCDNFKDLELSNCWFDTSLTVSSNEDKEFSKQVTLQFDGIVSGNYIIENLPTLSINLTCINLGNVIFNNMPSKIIHMENLFNYGKLFFNSLAVNEKGNFLLIYDSNIGNTEFQNIDFRKSWEVVIAKSDVSNLALTNSPFPLKIRTETSDPMWGYKVKDHQKIDDNIYFRDTYRQLKVAMGKIDDKYNSLRYKSQEMRYQRKHLRWGWDKILLTVNYLSNNYGISWTRGIIFTIACAYLTFLGLNMVSAHPIFHWNISASRTETLEAFRLGINAFFNLISTFPKMETELRIDGNWKLDLIIITGRIFIGIGIYQTISAFRKYAK